MAPSTRIQISVLKPHTFFFLHESALRPHVLRLIRYPKSHLYKNALYSDFFGFFKFFFVSSYTRLKRDSLEMRFQPALQVCSLLDNRGVLLGILEGGVPPGSPNPDPYFRPKNVIILTRFQSWTQKSTRFHTWQRQKLCHHYLD